MCPHNGKSVPARGKGTVCIPLCTFGSGWPNHSSGCGEQHFEQVHVCEKRRHFYRPPLLLIFVRKSDFSKIWRKTLNPGSRGEVPRILHPCGAKSSPSHKVYLENAHVAYASVLLGTNYFVRMVKTGMDGHYHWCCDEQYDLTTTRRTAAAIYNSFFD